MSYLKIINNIFEYLCKFLVGSLLALFTMSIVAHVFLRSVFSYPLSWAQDGAVMLFIWMVFLGAPVALRYRMHFAIDLFGDKVPRLGYVLNVVYDVLVYLFLYVMIVYGVDFLKIAHSMYYSYLYIRQSYVVVAIPLSGFIMFFMNTENLIVDLRALTARSLLEDGGDVL